jgi:dTDP-glucose pyrophosphorylase
MKEWRKTVIPPEASLRDAIASLERSKGQIALVLRGDALAGVVTDGDIRRALLGGADLSTPITAVMNPSPTSAPVATARWRLLNRMREASLHQLPLVDPSGRVVDLVSLDELAGVVKRPNAVVVMAGGLGTRLEALTSEVPKPMLKVGNRPILESILESFIDQGFRTFYFAVHYQAEIIVNHFRDGGAWGVSIEYLQEKEQLGTAGALSLLPRIPSAPVVVMNGDILTRVDVNEILEFHDRQGATATMAVREYEIRVPYGVVSTTGSAISGIVEKPVHHYLVNAGIYVVAPEALAHIPAEQYFDMPMLFEKLIAGGMATAAFPVRDYWLDVGRIEELERARREWPTP